MAEKSPFFRNFASHILPVLTFATLLVGTALVGVALTRIPQRPTDAAPPVSHAGNDIYRRGQPDWADDPR